MTWDTSTRRSRLPRGWATIRKRILQRDRHRCQHPADQHPGLICAQPATDVDHKRRDGGDHDDNLWSLCREHHKRKTSAEAAAARAARPTTRRPPERHPGLLP